MFYNYSTEKFTYPWADKPFSFEAGKVYEGFVQSNDGAISIQLNEIVSRFFAKHLAEHLLNQATSKNFENNPLGGKPIATDGYPLKYNMTNMDLLTDRGVTPPGVSKPLPDFKAELNIAKELKDGLEVVSNIVEEAKPLEVPEEPKKKLGRPKKVTSPSPEAEFAL